jgi:DHA1 family tetracycline resistance protein-like MFS transporter
MLIFGMMAGIAGLVLMAIAPDTALFWAGMPVLSLWGFIGPSAQAIMTRLVPPGKQGQLQGAGSSLMGVASLVSPTIFAGTFALGILPAWGAPLPGAPYLVAALVLTVALYLAWRVTAAVAAGPTDNRP